MAAIETVLNYDSTDEEESVHGLESDEESILLSEWSDEEEDEESIRQLEWTDGLESDEESIHLWTSDEEEDEEDIQSIQPHFGGYGYEFVDDVLPSQTCPVCLLPMRDAVQTTECGHRFCRECLQTILSRYNPVCPTDRSEIAAEGGFFADKAWAREISCLRVKCEQNKRGCEWIGEVKHAEEHRVKCPYEEQQCIACGEDMQRRLQENHMKIECPKRIVECEFCEDEFSLDEKQYHEETYCRSILLLCTNNCGREDIPREKASQQPPPYQQAVIPQKAVQQITQAVNRKAVDVIVPMPTQPRNIPHRQQGCPQQQPPPPPNMRQPNSALFQQNMTQNIQQSVPQNIQQSMQQTMQPTPGAQVQPPRQNMNASVELWHSKQAEAQAQQMTHSNPIMASGQQFPQMQGQQGVPAFGPPQDHMRPNVNIAAPLHQLSQTLKSPNLHNRQKQVKAVSILKQHPQLMTAFIKHGQLAHQQRQQQQQQSMAQQGLQQGLQHNMQPSLQEHLPHRLQAAMQKQSLQNGMLHQRVQGPVSQTMQQGMQNPMQQMPNASQPSVSQQYIRHFQQQLQQQQHQSFTHHAPRPQQTSITSPHPTPSPQPQLIDEPLFTISSRMTLTPLQTPTDPDLSMGQEDSLLTPQELMSKYIENL